MMNSRKTVILTSIAVPALASTALAAATGKDTRPNILIIVSDDMGWWEPGFNGDTIVPTPNMDRLAKEGLKLTQFYVNPVSSPTRAALMTGRYAFRCGMEERSHGNDVAGMLPDERTIAQAMTEAGYFTFLTGKWHLGNWYQRQLPQNRGFQYHYGLYGALVDYYGHDRDGILDWHRNGMPLQQEGYTTFLITDEFEKVVNNRDKSKPFFGYLAYNAVHSPVNAPQEYLDKYAQYTKNKVGMHYATLDCLDVAIGRALKCLEDNGVYDNTIIVFFNDNGAPAAIGNKPYRGLKGDMYEGGVRVPCVVKWPGVTKAGATNDGMLFVADLYPTLINAAGGSLKQPLPIDGMDIRATLSGKSPSPRTEIVHWMGTAGSHSEDRAIRIGDYKLLEKKGKSDYSYELYNITQDPYETKDLASAEPARVKQMTERLHSFIPQIRTPEAHDKIPGSKPKVFGEGEDALLKD